MMSRFFRFLTPAANLSVVANWAFPDSSERVLAKLPAAQDYFQAKTAMYRSYFPAIAVIRLVPQIPAQISCRA